MGLLTLTLIAVAVVGALAVEKDVTSLQIGVKVGAAGEADLHPSLRVGHPSLGFCPGLIAEWPLLPHARSAAQASEMRLSVHARRHGVCTLHGETLEEEQPSSHLSLCPPL